MNRKDSELARDFEFSFDEVERRRSNRQNHSKPHETLHSHHYSLTPDERRNQPAPGFSERSSEQHDYQRCEKASTPALVAPSQQAAESEKEEPDEPCRIAPGQKPINP